MCLGADSRLIEIVIKMIIWMFYSSQCWPSFALKAVTITLISNTEDYLVVELRSITSLTTSTHQSNLKARKEMADTLNSRSFCESKIHLFIYSALIPYSFHINSWIHDRHASLALLALLIFQIEQLLKITNMHLAATRPVAVSQIV